MRLLTVVAAVAVSVFAAFLFLQPIFSNINNWGLYDWDQHFFYHESAKVSLLTFNQFPLWTPYYCGGNTLLANPQSQFLSPFFLLVLLFGAVVGLKLEALVYLALGLLGTFLVAKKLGCSNLASVFAATVFMFSSWFSARVVVGHTTFFPFALLPFLFLFYLNSVSAQAAIQHRIRWITAAAMALAVMFLSGGIYPFYATVLLLALYSILDLLSLKKITPVAAVAAILALSFLLASVKFLPVIDFASGVEAEKDVQLTSAGIVFKSLLSRSQSIAEKDFETGRDLVPESRQKYYDTLAGKIPWGWHEYSAYLGIIPLLLAAVATVAVVRYRKNWKLVVSALFFLWLAFGSHITPSIWELVRKLPFFSSLHGPSRFIIVFVFLTALLAANTLSTVKLPVSKRVGTAILAAILVVAAVDLFLVSRSLFVYEGQNIAFPRTSVEIKSTNLGNPEFIQMLSSAPDLAQYQNLLQGIGTLNCYERLHLKIRPLPQFVDGVPYKGFIGNAYIAETNSSLNFTYFSPQKISLKLPQINSTSTLIVNQNYYKGWKVRVGSGKDEKALSFNGLIAAKISPSDSGKEIAFHFTSKPFIFGATISFFAVITAIIIFLRPNKVAAIIRNTESYVFRQS